MSHDAPVEVAHRVWWVGKRLPGDEFQCHAYLVENGPDSVLVDPGSVLTIEETLRKVVQVVDLADIRYVLCHHPDPDIASSLPRLGEALPREDAVVVTEWRAEALLKHYGHRFGHWLVEDHDWRLPLDGGELQFQLTPYLHFPGAFMSYDTRTGTLFTSDLFGGFVGDEEPLLADDVGSAIDSARDFHQHYMPSASLLQAGLQRVQRRWPAISLIAPQHGRLIPGPMVEEAFESLMAIECGVFALSDVDHDLKHLLAVAEAKQQLMDTLLTIADPGSLVASLDAVLHELHPGYRCELYIKVPRKGWTLWRDGIETSAYPASSRAQTIIELGGHPVAVLGFGGGSGEDDDVAVWIEEMAESIGPAVDQYLGRVRDADRIARLRRASVTDPLTGLLNRRALDHETPVGHYSLVSLDIDYFKAVNDDFGHASGDRVLREVSRQLAAEIRTSDRAYRVGGEEFLIVLPDSTGAEAVAIAERIRTTVAALPFDGHALDGRVTISAGVVEAIAATADDFPAVLERADAALYASKDLGRDRVTLAH